MFRPRKPFLALVALLALVAAACAGGGQTQQERSESPEKVFELASSNMFEVETMRFEMKMGAPGLFEMTATGFQDVGEGNMAMSWQMPSLGPGMPPMSMEQLLVDNVMYMRSAFFTELLPAGKSWIKMDLAQMGAEMGFDFEALLEQSQGSDPLAQMEMLQGLDGEIEELGSELIRGVPTTHYRFTVDAAQAFENPAFEGMDLDAVREQLGDQQIPIELWIDRDNLMRRMRYSMDMQDPESGRSLTMTFESDFFDFGAEQDVTAPPEAEVVDAMEAFSGPGT